MDADTRHQLKQNELAEAIQKLRELDKSTVYLIVAILVIIVLFAAYRIWTWQSARAEAANWQSLVQMGQPATGASPDMLDGLRGIADGSTTSALSNAARLELAGALAAEATETSDPQKLTEAAAVLQPLVDQHLQIPPAVGGPALYLLAGIQESQRDFDGARATYEMLQSDHFAGSSLQVLVSAKLDSLDSLRTPIALQPGLPPQPQSEVVAPTPADLAAAAESTPPAANAEDSPVEPEAAAPEPAAPADDAAATGETVPAEPEQP